MAVHTCTHCSSIKLVLSPEDLVENFTNKFSFTTQQISSASAAGCSLFQECTRLFRELDSDNPTDYRISLRIGFRNGRVFLKFGNRRPSWYEAYTNGNDPCAAFISARPASTNGNPTQSFSLAKDWLSDCLKNAGNKTHYRCLPPNPTGFLPTLLLKFMPKSDSFQVHLCDPSQDQYEPYACLSYCWGGDQRTKLSATTRSAWLGGIPINDLPTIVIEAIAVLNSLNIHYLWVDALCIAQDDPEDVSKQVGMMPQIYQNATVTITASTASSCYESFLSPTSPPPLFRAGLAMSVELPGSEKGTMFLRDCDDDAPFREPVGQRAWTLQENILSPRLLEYGYERMRWSCRSIQTSQGGNVQNPGRYSPRFIFSEALDVDAHGSTQAHKALAWWRVVNDFTRRKLTFPMDKLPAISAIASELAASSEPRDDYLAGLWRRDLSLHLGWRADFPRRTRPSSYRAPSWSWAAVDSPTFHPHAASGAYMWQRMAEATEHVKIIECSTEVVSPAAKYASIKSAHLVIQGLVLDATLRHTGTEYEVQSSLFLLQERTKSYYPDAIEDEDFIESTSGRNVTLLLIIPGDAESNPQGIVVTQRHDDGPYSRIGYFILKPSRAPAAGQESATSRDENSLPPGNWATRIMRII